MKTQGTFLKKTAFVFFLLIGLVAFNPLQAQNDNSSAEATQGKTIKGIVTDGTNPLQDVNVTLKGANAGTVTDAKGEFTFPRPLKVGDVLQFSYLGFATKEAKINANTNFIRMEMSEEVIEVMGSLNSNKRYKSKKRKQ